MRETNTELPRDYNNNKQFHRLLEFGSLAELARWCIDKDTPHPWDSWSSTATNRQSWRGSQTLEEACNWAINGDWQAPNMPDLTAAYDHGGMGEVPTAHLVSDVAGVLPNVPAYCAGLPDSMFQLVSDPAPQRVIRLMMGRCYSSSVSSLVISNISIKVLAWIASIEAYSKVSVEIVLCSASNHDQGHSQTMLCKIKRAGEAVDISELAFGLVSTAYFRRMGFRVLESMHSDAEDYSYGRPSEPSDDILDRCDLYLPNISASDDREAWQCAEKYIGMLDAFISDWGKQ